MTVLRNTPVSYANRWLVQVSPRGLGPRRRKSAGKPTSSSPDNRTTISDITPAVLVNVVTAERVFRRRYNRQRHWAFRARVA